MVQSHIGLDPDHLLLGRLEEEVGAAVGLVGAAEVQEPLWGWLGRKGTKEGVRGEQRQWGTMAPLPVPPAPWGAGTAPRRHHGSAGGCCWGVVGGWHLPPSPSPAASCTWPRSSTPFGYWDLPGRWCHPERRIPINPLPWHQSWENYPTWGKKWGEGGCCHEEVMGASQNLSPLPAASRVVPYTIAEKLPGEAQGVRDVSSLDGGIETP